MIFIYISWFFLVFSVSLVWYWISIQPPLHKNYNLTISPEQMEENLYIKKKYDDRFKIVLLSSLIFSMFFAAMNDFQYTEIGFKKINTMINTTHIT